MRNAVHALMLTTRVLLGLGAVTLMLGLSAMYGAELAEEPAGSAVGVGFVTAGSALMGLGALVHLRSLQACASVRNSDDSPS